MRLTFRKSDIKPALVKKQKKNIPLAPALLRGLDILEDLHDQAVAQSVSEIAERLKLPANSTLRLLMTLESKGYVERNPESLQYRLTRKAGSLALYGAREQSLMETALPFMRELRNQTGETVHLSVIENGHGVVLEHMPSTHVFRFVCNPGATFGLHTAASAKAILATLPAEDRERLLAGYRFVRMTPATITARTDFERSLERGRKAGYWEDHAEGFDGINCVASPVFNAQGYPVAAITVTGPSSRMGRAEMQTHGKQVAVCAAAVSARLGYEAQTAPAAH